MPFPILYLVFFIDNCATSLTMPYQYSFFIGFFLAVQPVGCPLAEGLTVGKYSSFPSRLGWARFWLAGFSTCDCPATRPTFYCTYFSIWYELAEKGNKYVTYFVLSFSY